MIESNKICEILKGIDSDECYDKDGWWETSYGAKFGKERLKELLDYITLEKNDIGLKDINSKKIYADSSIVKLGKDTGFIKYSPFLSANVFVCLSSYKTEHPLMEYSLFNINNMEIIDTVQENKLGLIK